MIISFRYTHIPSVDVPLPENVPEGSEARHGAAAGLLGADGTDKIQMVGLLLSLGKLMEVAKARSEGEEPEQQQAALIELLNHLPGARLSEVRIGVW